MNILFPYVIQLIEALSNPYIILFSVLDFNNCFDILYFAALNEALKQEVERLRIATGEMASPSDAYNLGMQHVPYNQSAFFAHQHQSGANDSPNTRMPQYNNLQQPGMPNHHHQMLSANHVQGFSDAMQQDPLGRFQGLDIGSSRGSHLGKPEGPSISASESSSTF